MGRIVLYIFLFVIPLAASVVLVFHPIGPCTHAWWQFVCAAFLMPGGLVLAIVDSVGGLSPGSLASGWQLATVYSFQSLMFLVLLRMLGRKAVKKPETKG